MGGEHGVRRLSVSGQWTKWHCKPRWSRQTRWPELHRLLLESPSRAGGSKPPPARGGPMPLGVALPWSLVFPVSCKCACLVFRFVAVSLATWTRCTRLHFIATKIRWNLRARFQWPRPPAGSQGTGCLPSMASHDATRAGTRGGGGSIGPLPRAIRTPGTRLPWAARCDRSTASPAGQAGAARRGAWRGGSWHFDVPHLDDLSGKGVRAVGKELDLAFADEAVADGTVVLYHD